MNATARRSPAVRAKRPPTIPCRWCRQCGMTGGSRKCGVVETAEQARDTVQGEVETLGMKGKQPLDELIGRQRDHRLGLFSMPARRLLPRARPVYF